MIAVTGASGYVGGTLVRHLTDTGYRVLPLFHHRQTTGAGGVFSFESTMAPGALDGVSVVVHAAWDFSVRGEKIRERNVSGALPLLAAAKAAGAKVVHISSMSAHRDCASRYGAAKFELERLVAEQGGISLRPGLIYGPSLSGMFGTIARAITGHRFVPVLTAKHPPRIFLSDDGSLAKMVATLVDPRYPGPMRQPYLAAHPQPILLRALINRIAASLHRQVTGIPVPWRPAFRLLQFAEAAGLRPPFRSDSLLAIADPVPSSEVAQLLPPPVDFADPEFANLLAGSNPRSPVGR